MEYFPNEAEYLQDIPAEPKALEDHIEKLRNKTIDEREPSLNGFDEEFFYIEVVSSKAFDTTDFKSALIASNRTKNRYSNVLPPENTRVKLIELPGEDGSDYINANFIGGLIPGSEKQYVATQGPLQYTFGDFWRMIWDLKTMVIVMLTKEIENGRLKCDRYWPEDDCPLNSPPFKVSLLNIEGTEDLTERTLEVHNVETNEKRIVHQFQYTSWPDHDLPTTANPTHAFLELAHKVDQVNTNNSPLVVHCSAGIGRSGTFCTVHSIIEKFRLDLKDHPSTIPHFSIVKTILQMRLQRPGMVQTREQFMFCYLTLLEESKRLYSNTSLHNSVPSLPNLNDDTTPSHNNNTNNITKNTSTPTTNNNTSTSHSHNKTNNLKSSSNSTVNTPAAAVDVQAKK